MAGKGTELGSTIEQLSTIINGINNKDKSKIGICLDTCHLSDSGLSISSFDEILDCFDKYNLFDKIGCIHVNDSKNPVSSHKDRHENIGYGTIGFSSLLSVIYNKRLENIPKILETPYIEGKPPYKYEIEMIRNKSFDEKLFEKVING